MADYDQWGRKIGGGGAGGYDQWGRAISGGAPSGGGGGGGIEDLSHGASTISKGIQTRFGGPSQQASLHHTSLGGMLAQEALSLPLGVTQGLYGTGKASLLTLTQNPKGAIAGAASGGLIFSLLGAEAESHLLKHKPSEFDKKVIQPQYDYYDWKYGPGIRHGDWNTTWKRMQAEPLGSILDIAAVGTIPIGGEGFAIKGLQGTSRVAELGAAREAIIGRGAAGALQRVSRSTARGAHYVETKQFGPFGLLGRGGNRPNPLNVGGQLTEFPEGYTMARSRSIQGRIAIDPLKKRYGNTAGRYGKALTDIKNYRVGPELRQSQTLSDRAEFRTNRLPKSERQLVKLAAEAGYENGAGQLFTGLEATRMAPLGQPRQELVAMIETRRTAVREVLDYIDETGEMENMRVPLAAELDAMSKDLVNLGATNEERAAFIDATLKNPSKQFVDAYRANKDLQEHTDNLRIKAGEQTPESIEARRDLPMAQRADTSPTREAQQIEYQQAKQEGQARTDVKRTRSQERTAARKAHGERQREASDVRKQVADLDKSSGLAAAKQAEQQAGRRVAALEKGVAKLEGKAGKTKERSSLKAQLETARKQHRNAQAEVEHAQNRRSRQSKELRSKLRNAEARTATSQKTLRNAENAYDAATYKHEAAMAAQRSAKEALERSEKQIASNPAVERMESDLSGFIYPHHAPSYDAAGELDRSRMPVQPYAARKQLASDMTGRRYMNRILEQNPEAWTREAMDVQRLYQQSVWSKLLKETVAIPHNAKTGVDDLLPDYTPINLDGVRADAYQANAERVTQSLIHAEPKLREEFLAASEREMLYADPDKQHWQIPTSIYKRLEKEVEQSKGIWKWYDNAMAVWKSLTLRYRPAWVINNIIGQHILYMLFNGGMRNYLEALDPNKRKQIAQGIRGGLLMTGTETVAGHGKQWKYKSYGLDVTKGERSKFGGVPGGHGKLSRIQPRKVFEGFGDLMARLNVTIADDIPRTAYAIKLLKERQRSLANAERFSDELADRVGDMSIEEFASHLSEADSVAILRGVNHVLGDFRGIGKWTGRAIPFGNWFRVVMAITKDIALDHPEKLLAIWNMEQAAAQDEDVIMPFPVPSWLNGSIKMGPIDHGIQGGLVTTGVNPFNTLAVLAAQGATFFSYASDEKGNVKPASGPDSPFASLSPFFQMLDVWKGRDPFTGEAYAGVGSGQGPLVAAPAYILVNLPQVRLAQQLGWVPGYKEPKTYQPTHGAAIGQFLGLPYRNIRVEQAKKYAGIYP